MPGLPTRRHFSRPIRRIVVKVGTNILATPEGKPDLNNMRVLVGQLASLVLDQGMEVLLVTSGAITCGSERLRWVSTAIEEKQGSAAVGQILLMSEYARFFDSWGVVIGQILLTPDVFQSEERCALARNTMFALLRHKVVPVINENDTVATDEIKFGDNDHLSAQVANLIDADMLILLSDIDGLFSSNPKLDSTATLISTLDLNETDGRQFVNDQANARSRGGMSSKLSAASAVVQRGGVVVIANGRSENTILDAASGQIVGTWVK